MENEKLSFSLISVIVTNSAPLKLIKRRKIDAPIRFLKMQ